MGTVIKCADMQMSKCANERRGNGKIVWVEGLPLISIEGSLVGNEIIQTILP